jgi:hypothetical protein
VNPTTAIGRWAVRWACERGQSRSLLEYLSGDGVAAVDRRSSALAVAPGVRPDDDIGVESGRCSTNAANRNDHGREHSGHEGKRPGRG